MKKIISLSVAMMALMSTAFAATYNVTVSASNSSSALLESIGYSHLADVTELTVTGTLNGYDFMAIRNKLPKLSRLDLSAVTILVNDYPYYETLRLVEGEFPAHLFDGCGVSDVLTAVSLPQTVTSVGDAAFKSCSKLTELTLPTNLRTLGNETFSKCTSLVNVLLPVSLETIGNDAFNGCSKVRTVNFPSVLQSIGRNGFAGCSSLQEVHFAGSLNSIGDYAFTRCTGIKTLRLSNRISSIGTGAFNGCNQIEELSLPSSLDRLGSQAFADCRALRRVYAQSAQPVPMSQNTFPAEIFDACTLYVPQTSYSAYYWDTQWSQFSQLVAIDFEYENLYISNTGTDYQLDATTGVFAGTPEIAILPGGGVIIRDDINQQASEVILMTDGSQSGSIIATDNLSAASLTMQLKAKKNCWYFFALPYDALLRDVHCSGNWVIRTYNGRTRADSGSGWVSLAPSETSLKSGKGYIFQTDVDGTLYIEMKNPVFTSDNRTLRINLYDAADLHDASWNFLGNPFPTYYCIADMSYSSPITIYDQATKTYVALSPSDDTYHLAPFQAFFVQKSVDVNSITFSADSRRTYVMSQNLTNLSAPAMRDGEAGRLLVDLQLVGEVTGTMSDRTRVVYNNEKSYGYDLGADASKFFSADASLELFTCDASGSYAINERPMSGDLAVGFRVAQPGRYTLATLRADVPLMLYDRHTGVTCPLDETGYTFHSEAGTFLQRFVIFEATNAVEQTRTEENGSQTYDLMGRPIEQELSAGVYVSGHKKLIVQ